MAGLAGAVEELSLLIKYILINAKVSLQTGHTIEKSQNNTNLNTIESYFSLKGKKLEVGQESF